MKKKAKASTFNGLTVLQGSVGGSVQRHKYTRTCRVMYRVT